MDALFEPRPKEHLACGRALSTGQRQQLPAKPSGMVSRPGCG
jgi:hypothetical protein